MIKITFTELALPEDGAIVLGILEGNSLISPYMSNINAYTNGAITRAMTSLAFEGRREQSLVVLAPHKLSVTCVILVGLGRVEELNVRALEIFGGIVVEQLITTKDTVATLVIDIAPTVFPFPEADMVTHAAFGACLRSYRFDKYKTTEKPEEKLCLRELRLVAKDTAKASELFFSLEKVADAVFFTRSLISEPANIIYPESFAIEMKELSKLGLEIEILDETQMKILGMNALLAVGQGSTRQSKLVVFRWYGASDRENQPIALVGKGVTFDSGGLSIKPSAGMEDMKWDMGGAGVVAGVMKVIASRKAKVNVIGIVGMVENMPSGTAQRPGDVIVSASGQTIEVLNTDAEGRLVLADVLWYAQKHYSPQLIVDLATLTGAIVVALGSHYAGLFSNNDSLAKQLIAAGEIVNEKLWWMPLSEEYDKQIRSDIADMKNTGEREAGAITAAQFLKRFIIGPLPWAHIDIAGVTWSKQDTSVVPKGATAFGVRLLERFIADNYETKD